MSELLVLALKLAFLALLWLFVLFAVNVIRTDLFGRRVPVEAAEATPKKPREKKRKTKGQPKSLRITQGRQAGLTMPLGEMLKIGRSDDCQLILDDDYVSTRHARIYAVDSGFLVEDLGSTNGTFLNDVRITAPTPFTLSDTLRIGRTQMVVEK
jgi:hypothetical protein